LSRALAGALAAAEHVPAALDHVRELPGEGVEARWHGRHAALRRPDAGPREGMACAVSIDGGPAFLVPFADRLRPDAADALDRLAAQRVPCAIISGDGAEAVAAVARTLSVGARGQVRPADKQAAIAALQAQGHRVLMVGDGLNDGPALAAADASMAPGSASDVGRQAADLVFLGDSLMAVPRALGAARATMRVVKQNFVLAIGYNALAVPLAMAGKVTPLLAAALMSLSSLIVIANSLRLALPSAWNPHGSDTSQ
jgi:Cu2+-exporting ATPase